MTEMRSSALSSDPLLLSPAWLRMGLKSQSDWRKDTIKFISTLWKCPNFLPLEKQNCYEMFDLIKTKVNINNYYHKGSFFVQFVNKI